MFTLPRFAPPLIALPGISPRIVTGRKKLAAALAFFLRRWRLAKSAAPASFSPFYGEKMAAAR